MRSAWPRSSASSICSRTSATSSPATTCPSPRPMRFDRMVGVHGMAPDAGRHVRGHAAQPRSAARARHDDRARALAISIIPIQLEDGPLDLRSRPHPSHDARPARLSGRPYAGASTGQRSDPIVGRVHTATRSPPPIAPGTRIGHVHLKVADLDRALAFYCGVLGFELMQRYGARGRLHFGGRLSSPHRPEHLGEQRRPATAAGHDRPVPHGHPVSRRAPRSPTPCAACRRPASRSTAPSDHGVSEALYLRDPDDNGVELYCDRAPADWPREVGGGLAMFTRRLDLASLLAEPPLS